MYDAINNGAYENKLPYPKPVRYECPKCGKVAERHNKYCSTCGAEVENFMKRAIDRHKKEVDAFGEAQAKLYLKFKKDALAYCGYFDHPKADLIFARAWEEGHSAGFYSVLQELQVLCEFLDEFQK